MPFLRPGQVVAFASPTPKMRQFGLLTLFSLSAAASVSARTKPAAKPVGVQAWTSGSQTYIRSRPGAAVPPVAKVARHTPLYVWGKFNGWYRVETHDHIFGWVFNDYLNAPGLDKVPNISQAKAKIASNRTANQTMYGTPEVLKKHYAMYGAPGALKGLKKQGIYLATAPKPAPKSKVEVAKAARTSPKLVAAAPRVREKVTAAPVAPRAITPSRTAEPVEASPVPVIETPDNAAPVTNVAPVEAAPRDVATEKITGSMNGTSSSARLFARAASAATQSGEAEPVLAQSTPVPVAPVAPVAAKPVVSKPVAPKPAPKVVAAKPKPPVKKPVAKTTRQSRYAASREKKREELRVKMGLSPNSKPPTVIAPVSPLELMKAREEYLNSRKERLNSPAASAPAAPTTVTPEPVAPTPDAPTVGVAPLPAPSGPLGGPTGSALAPAAPGTFNPMAWHADPNGHPLDQIISNPEILAMAHIKPKAKVVCAPAPKKAPVSARGGAPRGGSPRDRAEAVRGGSPRDRLASGMANQALSYRGMPYIRGAASPSRGFDCSGLVYFLLRQRGYNPPRTAAGYKNWGASVPRGEWKAGDLVLFANTYKRGISHIGVYLGEGKFVHAATSGTGVRVSSLNEAYYARKYYGARRIK